MKYLVDTQANFAFVEMLRALGWTVNTVYEFGIEHMDDAALVAWAREHGFTFISFDKFRGETRARVHEELRLRGGKVIVIAGGPAQPVERAVGRLLFHYPEWYPKLSNEDGRIQIGDLSASLRWESRARLQETQVGVKFVAEQLESYLQQRTAGQPPRRTRRRKPRDDQGHLRLSDGA